MQVSHSCKEPRRWEYACSPRSSNALESPGQSELAKRKGALANRPQQRRPRASQLHDRPPPCPQMPSEAEHALMAEDCAPDTHHASMSLPALKHTTSSIAACGADGNAGTAMHPGLPCLPLREQLQHVRHLQQYLTSFEAQVRHRAPAQTPPALSARAASLGLLQIEQLYVLPAYSYCMSRLFFRPVWTARC